MIVLDVETTGTHFYENSIVSIGALDLDRIQDKTKSKDALFYGECTIWPGAKINLEALNRNGFTIGQATTLNSETHEELTKRFVSWLEESENRTMCGENIDFDIRFLRESLLKSGYDSKFAYEIVGIRGNDIHTLSYQSHEKRGIPIPMKHKRSALSLDETLKYVGLPIESDPHNGLIGAILEAETYWRLKHGTSLLSKIPLKEIIPPAFPKDRLKDILEFKNYPIPRYLLQNQQI